TFDADFADIFEIRGHKRLKEGQYSQPELSDRSIHYRYLGIDGVSRRTLIQFDQPPASIDAHRVSFDVTLQPHETATLSFRIIVDEHTSESSDGHRGIDHLRHDYTAWHESFTRVHCDNEIFSQVLSRSITDLRMLVTKDGHGSGYLVAGTPWFATLFGRD